MSKYGEYIKSRKEKDIKFFFGDDAKILGNNNPDIEWNRVKDDDQIIIVTNKPGQVAFPQTYGENDYVFLYLTQGAGELMEIEGQKLACKEMCHNTMEMFGLELLEGRELNDTLDNYSYNCLLNETAVRQQQVHDALFPYCSSDDLHRRCSIGSCILCHDCRKIILACCSRSGKEG